ncbi:phage portal protein [Mergibacter septicus]|uniref:phage portal protein n=1 Tax=Mergibacter septicus TaxID=221402 RepID=UPI001C77E95D|nr:phage portal protein [Mergibacter septicus]QDJ13092.1 phage portal protein [Mergibacter septicus]
MQDKNVMTFTFGEPVPVLDRREIMQYFETALLYNKYYSPPISFSGLAKSYHSTSHHSSALSVKKNILLSTCKTSNLLSRTELEKFINDFLIFGNAYLFVQLNKLDQPLKITSPLAKYMRRGVNAGEYYQITATSEYQFPTDCVFHLIQPDVNQEIYGLPEYISALQSSFLNEAATLFRRKYYLNGAHAGSIIYLTDDIQNQADIDSIKEQLNKAKGMGNFKNLFIHSPTGDKKGLQVIPLSDISAKDEFLNIKNTSRDDILAAHRVPPQLMGIIPNNTAGFGDVEKAARVFFINEIEPLQRRLEEVNNWIQQNFPSVKKPVISFDKYELLKEDKY